MQFDHFSSRWHCTIDLNNCTCFYLFSQKSISIHEEDKHKRVQNVDVWLACSTLWEFLDEPFKPNFIHEERYKKNSLNYHHLKFWEWYIFSLSPMTKEKLPLSCERSFIYTSLYLPETKVNQSSLQNPLILKIIICYQ
jgi:hypothetical protein